jgi:tetratricopeptide (TPR) repeat protein/transcriptional regulator with XRE-family HTH domain
MSLDQPTFPGEPLTAADGRIVLDAVLLKSLRKARGLSQEALAELCARRQLPVSIASIKRAETGKVVLYRTARQLATVFEVDLDTLIDDAAPAQPSTQDDGDLPGLDASVRYVIALHIALDTAPAPGSEVLQHIGAAVQRFGGRLSAPDGDHAVALFGLPQAFGSDAERCLRCALELRAVLDVHGALGLAIRLQASAGDLTMPALHARGDETPPPLLVARNVVSQLSGRFDFDGGAQALPGFQRFVRVLEGDAGAAGALIGRSTETRQFRAVAGATRDSQAGHIIYLRAMAGVGKSRLAAQFAELARADGFGAHRCEVMDAGAGAESWRAPLDQLARSLFGGADNIEAVAAQLGLDADAAIFHRAMTGATMNSEQMTLYAAMSHDVRERGMSGALLQLIVRLAARAPLLLAVEDVHWGAPYLFEALCALLSNTREAPVVWVLTSRIEHDPFDAALRPHLFDVPLTVFDLAPLAPREAQALADQFEAVSPAYRLRCVERARGNPLFLTQLLASPDHLLPDSLKHLIQTRVDALAPLQRRALRTAAVMGNHFELALLREALGEPDYEPEAAGRNSLVRRISPDTFTFVHDLVMHCIYESIDAVHQRRMHRALAAVYREHDPAQSAQHLYRADDPAAFDMMLRAIRDKLAAHDYEDALELTAQCSANDSTRYSSFTLALLKAHATAGMGQMQQARLAYQHALMLAGRPQEKIDAVVGLATTLNLLEELDEEERLLDDTLPLARSINAEASLGKLLYLKGNIYFPRGNFSECRRHHEDAVRYARSSATTEIEARALSGMGDSYYAQGRMRKAFDLFSECVDMCETHRYVAIEASNRSALGSTRLYLGQPGEAVDDALHSALLAHKIGNRRAEIVARMTAGWVLVAQADLQRAQHEVGAALELSRTMGSTRFEPFLMESQARISWLGGDHALAEQQIVEAARAVERLKLHRFIGPWVLGTLALFTSDEAVRRKAMLQGAAYLTRDCLAHNAYRYYVSASEVALLEGDLVAAEFYADQLAAFSVTEPCAWTNHHVSLVRAYADFAKSPGEARREQLRALQVRSVDYGFAHASPRLFRSIETL